MGKRLNGVIAEAARSRGVRYAKLEDVYENLGACGTDEWINAAILESDSGSGVNRPGSGSFHPKKVGHDAASERVANVLSQK